MLIGAKKRSGKKATCEGVRARHRLAEREHAHDHTHTTYLRSSPRAIEELTCADPETRCIGSSQSTVKHSFEGVCWQKQATIIGDRAGTSQLWQQELLQAWTRKSRARWKSGGANRLFDSANTTLIRALTTCPADSPRLTCIQGLNAFKD